MYSKVLTVAAVCVVCVLAAPPTDVVPLEKQQPTVIPIVSQSEELEANGTFKFSYETGNGIKREEEAYVKIVPKAKSRSASSDEGGESDEDSNEIHVQRGSYSYTAPDGTVIAVSYIADENGFQPIGDHIPRVPSAVPATSSEKSGKLLKPADSTVSASEPKKQAKLAPAPASAPAPAPASAPAPAPASAPAPVPASAQASASSALAASAPSPAANLSASDKKPEEPPKEATTEKSNENTEKLASEESLSESTSNPTSMQPNPAEATEASASTSTEASDEKQTTTNPITESSPTSDDQNPSTTSSTPSSGEESSSTTTAS